jgi:hypothetical protein
MGDRVDELNERMVQRFVPNEIISPQLFRHIPAQTRCVLFPISLNNNDNDSSAKYEAQTCFAPNIHKPPDFAKNIDVEMNLRNQYFAIQRGCVNQSVYVPSSMCDLYGKDRDDTSIIARYDSSPEKRILDFDTLLPILTRTQLKDSSNSSY